MSVYLSWATRMAVDALRGKHVRLALLVGYTQDPAHRVWADISSFEVSGSGYVSGGKPVVLDAYLLDQVVTVDCSPVDFGLLGVPSADTAVFYDDTGNPSTSQLLAADTFAPVVIAGTNFTYVPGGLGLTLAETVIEP